MRGSVGSARLRVPVIQAAVDAHIKGRITFEDLRTRIGMTSKGASAVVNLRRKELGMAPVKSGSVTYKELDQRLQTVEAWIAAFNGKPNV